MKKIIAHNLSVLRKVKGITQVILSDKTGINLKSIGAYEEGRALPPVDKLKLMADLY